MEQPQEPHQQEAPVRLSRLAYVPPRLTRYQRLQEMTRGDSPTGNIGAVEDCVIPGHCESQPT